VKAISQLEDPECAEPAANIAGDHDPHAIQLVTSLQLSSRRNEVSEALVHIYETERKQDLGVSEAKAPAQESGVHSTGW
jgi:hypothetical protein